MNLNAPPALTFQDYWNIAVRRKWLILGSVLFSLVVAGVLCLVLPKSYRSSTVILVEEQQIPEDYVKATAGSNIEERLSMIEQHVWNPKLLSQIIDELKLYQQEIHTEGLETVIEAMRQQINVKTVVGGVSPGKGVNVFSISFAHSDPKAAMKVTEKLASQFIEEHLRLRERFVEEASEFLEQELLAAKARLERQENEIRKFKAKYVGVLPQQMEANVRALEVIEKAITDYQVSGTTNPRLAAGAGTVDPVILRLRELEKTLTTLSAEYKETYPDILHVKKEIEKLRAQVGKKSGDPASEGDSSATKIADPYLRDLIKQRNEYQRRVERTPALEQELMIVLRDYQNTQTNYQSLLDKKLSAGVAENLQKRQKGGQFRIIDPPNLPKKPEKPDPLRITMICLALGCGLGFGSAVTLEFLQLSFSRSEEVEALLGLPVFATITDFKMEYGIGSAKSPSLFTIPVPLQRYLFPSAQKSEKEEVAVGVKDGNWRRMLLPWLKKFLNGSGRLAKGQAGTERSKPKLNLVSKWKPTSLVAEQFRIAATRILLTAGERANTIVVVTSAVKGEGKSATAINLAYTLARDLGKRTLLIDCDLKCPVLHTYAGVRLEPGISDILQGNRPFDACLHRLGELPVWIVTSGRTKDRHVKLSEIGELGNILAGLRERFEYIIIDTPPILPLADMNILAGMADVLTLVIRAGSTSRDVIQKAITALKPRSPSGVILTGLTAWDVPYYMTEYHYVGRSEQTHHVGQ